MKQRVITAVVLIAVLLPCVWLGGLAMNIVTYAFGMVACNELLNLSGKDWSLGKKLPVYFLFLLTITICIFKFDYFLISTALMIIYLVYLLVWFEEVKFDGVGILFLFYMIVGITIGSIMKMYSINKLLFIMTLIATYLSDSFAYFCGRAFGKHKLNERISPKKTIEGSVGGWVISTVLTTIFAFVTMPELSMTFILVSSVLLPVVGQLGDLAFSAIKRYFNIKDFGYIFPGHGGVLDRIDSLTLNCLLMYCLVVLL